MEKYLTRKCKEVKEFKVDGTFESFYAACGWLRDNGYGYGSMCHPQPIAVMQGDYSDYGLPEKWKNLTSKEKNSVHGVIVGDMREGPVYVRIFE